MMARILRDLGFVCFLIATPVLAQVDTHNIAYCSSDNTATTRRGSYIFQSHVHCMDECSDYAYALLLGDECSCSNMTPTNQQSLDQCNVVCSGWTTDSCGSPTNGLFAYLRIPGNKPSDSTSRDPSSTQSNPGPTASTQSDLPSSTSHAEPSHSSSASSPIMVTSSASGSSNPSQTSSASTGHSSASASASSSPSSTSKPNTSSATALAVSSGLLVLLAFMVSSASF